MAAAPEQWHYTSAGFWLPCYQSSFFAHTDRGSDRDVLRPYYDFTSGPFEAFRGRENLLLETSIYRRLLMVLPEKGYTAAYPLYSSKRQGHARDSADPNAVLYVSTAIDRLPGLSGCPLTAVTLLVQNDGHFIWTVAHHDHRVHTYDIQEVLGHHISELAGGTFCSHESGLAPPHLAVDTDSLEPPVRAARPNLTAYRDVPIGMLTFFQINTILEGLYNSNLDFRAFFKSDPAATTDYTLGGFVQHITAAFVPYPHHRTADQSKRPMKAPADEKAAERSTTGNEQVEQPGDTGRGPAGNAHLADAARSPFLDEVFWPVMGAPEAVAPALLNSFRDAVSTPTSRAHILDKFLTATEVISLVPMKKRIERCRRSLLDDLIEVTHRREPLVQAEPPDKAIDRIEDVNEAQLRGYVMLFSAKMPLLSNVLLHLEDLHYAKARMSQGRGQDDDVEALNSEAYSPFQSWKALLNALRNDVAGLKDAIDQAQSDRMLYEEEQIHAEQETLAEIQRIRERTDSAISPAHSLAINVIANLLAFFAVILATVALVDQKVIQLHVSFTDFLQIFAPQNWPVELELLKILLALVVGYAFIHFSVQLVIRSVVRLIKRDLRLDAQYYYELDVHIDAPFHADVLDAIFERGSPTSLPPKKLSPWRLLSSSWRRLQRRWRPGPHTRAKRNSYRAERLEKAEALHKIYVETDIRVGPGLLRLGPGRYIHAVLVYELLYHRPAQEHGYIFKDLRVVSTHARVLSKAEIVAFKNIVAEYFIDPCLPPEWKLHAPPADGHAADVDGMADSFYTVTERVS